MFVVLHEKKRTVNTMWLFFDERGCESEND
jgi:hypothetical protein